MNDSKRDVDRDTDRIEIIASQQAVDAANEASTQTEELLISLHEASREIRLAVRENGYLARFRSMLRGA